MSRLLAAAAAIALALPAAAGGLNPDAPPETEQYAFIVGAWDCKTKFMTGPSREYAEGKATWTGEYILDGWAIQDTWVSTLPNGKEFIGINIRSFDKETGKWDNRWLPQGTLKWEAFASQWVEGTMVMTGGEGQDAVGAFVDRNTFYDIEKDSWSWRKDRSYDGGKTWIEGIGYIYATRKK